MIWNRLKNMKCPTCNSGLRTIGNYFTCKELKCTFNISKQKFEEVVNDLYRKENMVFDHDNSSELNNLKLRNINEQ